MGKHEEITLVKQASWRPTGKVIAAWVTGSGFTLEMAILTWVTGTVDQGTFWGALGASVAAGLAGWLKKNRRIDGA